MRKTALWVNTCDSMVTGDDSNRGYVKIYLIHDLGVIFGEMSSSRVPNLLVLRHVRDKTQVVVGHPSELYTLKHLLPELDKNIGANSVMRVWEGISTALASGRLMRRPQKELERLEAAGSLWSLDRDLPWLHIPKHRHRMLLPSAMIKFIGHHWEDVARITGSIDALVWCHEPH